MELELGAVVRIDHLRCREILHDGDMKAARDQALVVRCPTCGAKPREKCELSTGLPRLSPHPSRCLAAEKG